MHRPAYGVGSVATALRSGLLGTVALNRLILPDHRSDAVANDANPFAAREMGMDAIWQG
jgi:hypothetical protein